jgi:hypothetical protein
MAMNFELYIIDILHANSSSSFALSIKPVELFMEAGCDEYMSKPINYKEFLKMVESFKTGDRDGE